MMEELSENMTPDTAEKHMMQVTQHKLLQARKERLKKLLRTEHLNEEKKSLE